MQLGIKMGEECINKKTLPQTGSGYVNQALTGTELGSKIFFNKEKSISREELSMLEDLYDLAGVILDRCQLSCLRKFRPKILKLFTSTTSSRLVEISQ
jgi:hypothetical protein